MLRFCSQKKPLFHEGSFDTFTSNDHLLSPPPITAYFLISLISLQDTGKSHPSIQEMLPTAETSIRRLYVKRTAKTLLIDNGADALEYLEDFLSNRFEVTACSKPS